VRRISWDPPQPSDPETVTLALAGYGARPWQVALIAGPLALALNSGEVEPQQAGGDD
jgi:ribonuclease D